MFSDLPPELITQILGDCAAVSTKTVISLSQVNRIAWSVYQSSQARFLATAAFTDIPLPYLLTAVIIGTYQPVLEEAELPASIVTDQIEYFLKPSNKGDDPEAFASALKAHFALKYLSNQIVHDLLTLPSLSDDQDEIPGSHALFDELQENKQAYKLFLPTLHLYALHTSYPRSCAEDYWCSASLLGLDSVLKLRETRLESLDLHRYVDILVDRVLQARMKRYFTAGGDESLSLLRGIWQKAIDQIPRESDWQRLKPGFEFSFMGAVVWAKVWAYFGLDQEVWRKRWGNGYTPGWRWTYRMWKREGEKVCMEWLEVEQEWIIEWIRDWEEYEAEWVLK